MLATKNRIKSHKNQLAITNRTMSGLQDRADVRLGERHILSFQRAVLRYIYLITISMILSIQILI